MDNKLCESSALCSITDGATVSDNRSQEQAADHACLKDLLILTRVQYIENELVLARGIEATDSSRNSICCAAGSKLHRKPSTLSSTVFWRETSDWWAMERRCIHYALWSLTSVPSIKVFASAGTTGVYTTLNHRFAIQKKVQILKRDASEHSTSIKFDRLSHTFKDAIEVTRKLDKILIDWFTL